MIVEDKWIGENLSSGGVLRINGNKEMRKGVRSHLIAGECREELDDREWYWVCIYWTIIGGVNAVRRLLDWLAVQIPFIFCIWQRENSTENTTAQRIWHGALRGYEPRMEH